MIRHLNRELTKKKNIEEKYYVKGSNEKIDKGLFLTEVSKKAPAMGDDLELLDPNEKKPKLKRKREAEENENIEKEQPNTNRKKKKNKED